MKIYLYDNYLVKEFHMNENLIRIDLIETDFTMDNCPSVNDCIFWEDTMYKVEERIYIDDKIILFIIEYKAYLGQKEAKFKNLVEEVVNKLLFSYFNSK